MFVACGQVHSSIYGSIKSPKFPGLFPISVRCHYLIKQWDPAARITLTFGVFNLLRDLTCAYDSVKIYDGDSLNANLLGPSYGFCGTARSPPLTSSGNSVLIVFTSEAYWPSSMFSIAYTGEFLYVSLYIFSVCTNCVCLKFSGRGGRGGDTFKPPSTLRTTFAFTHPLF